MSGPQFLHLPVDEMDRFGNSDLALLRLLHSSGWDLDGQLGFLAAPEPDRGELCARLLRVPIPKCDARGSTAFGTRDAYCIRERGHSGRCEPKELAGPAGFEPATLRLEGECSSPTELRARAEGPGDGARNHVAKQLHFNSVAEHFTLALAHGGLAVTEFCRAWVSLGARFCLGVLLGLAELDRQIDPEAKP
jgi:hypothetical protein